MSATRQVLAQPARGYVRDLGRAAASTRVDLAVTLAYHDEAQLEALIAASSDPASPEFGRFLTPAQFAADFAPTPAEYGRLVRFAQQAGFAVTHAFANRSVLDIAGPAALVEKYFGTEIHAVAADVPHAALFSRPAFYANVRSATLPPQWRGLVLSVAGFSNVPSFKAFNVRSGQRRADIAAGPPLQGPDTGLGPYAFEKAYDYPVRHAVPGRAGATYDGRGRNAAIVIDSDFPNSDLSGFLSYFKIKRTAPLARIDVDGGSGGITFDEVETDLDVETIAGVSPGAGIALYLIPSLSDGSIIDAYNTIVTDDKVDVVNSSFGGCEVGDPTDITFDHIAEQGAAEGITFSASSGDYGAQECIGVTPTYLGVSAPASGPHFTAVGGTSLLLTPAPAYKAEFAWVGSGGGVSVVFGQPAYQKGIAHTIASGRNVPDVALDADPGTGAAFYYNGAFAGPIGGTSLASPLFSSLVLQVDQVHGKRSGLINNALYARFRSAGYGKVFRDVIYGSNSYFGTGYESGPGYDPVTGIGSLLGMPYAR